MLAALPHTLRLAALAVAALVAGCSPQAPEPPANTAEAEQPAHGNSLIIKGSDTLGAELVPQLCELYKSQHPNFTYEVTAEGSSTGIAAVINGIAQIGMSSRAAKSTEEAAAQAKGVTLLPTVVALDGIAVIVNKANPLDNLTLRQVGQIFTGAATDWSGVNGKPGPASVYTRNTASGTYFTFQQLAMNGKDYADSTQKMAGNEQIASEVAANPNGIGYVGLAYLKTPGIKAVTIDGVAPSASSVRDMSYPLSRPTYYYTNGEPQGIAQNFVDFTLGPDGRKVIESVGFTPVQ